MINTHLSVCVENNYLEPFEDRIDILFRELELATKWKRPSVLWAIYSSEYVRADADKSLESRLHNLGQTACHIRIQNLKNADVSLQIAESARADNVVYFVEGLRWGVDQDDRFAYRTLNDRRDFFVDNQIRVVFWLTEKEAIDLAHFAPDYWESRHRVIEFVDSPRPDQISPQILESAWRGTGEFTDSTEDLDAKIALRTALLTDLPTGDESTSARANLLLTLGMLHWRRGDYERATQFLNTALDLAARLEDNYFEALCFNAIALVQTDLGRTREAIQAYQNAVSLAPEQIFPWNNLGHLCRKIGQHAEALAAFQKAIDQNAADIVAWNGLGDVYHETGRNDEAVHAYLKAIEISPDFAHSWSGLGNSHLHEGRLEEALDAHKKAIEIDRRSVGSWLGLGNIYKMQGNDENASLAYQTALELDPKNALVWNELGNLYYKAGAYDEAMRSYLKGIEFNQGCCSTYANLAAIYINKGLHAEAVPLLLRGLELSDDICGAAGLWKQLGDAYRQLDDYDNAVSAYRKADALASETTSTQTELSTSLPDLQPAPSQEVSAQPVLKTGTDPEVEGISLPDSLKPASVSSPNDIIVEEDTDTIPTTPDADFSVWLDGLSSVMPVNPQTEMPDPDFSNPLAAEQSDAVNVSDTEAESQTSKSDQQVEPVREETCFLSETPTQFSDQQFFSNLPTDEDVSVTLFQALDPKQDMEGADYTMANNDQDLTAHAETALVYEGPSQADLAEGQDTSQTQLSINEKNAQIWNELGNIYYNSGAFDEAMHAFEMAIELDPAYGWSYNNLASVCFQNKRYAEAIPLYEKGIQLLGDQKDKALLMNRMGDAYRKLNQREQAVSAYQTAMELDPENVSLLTRARFSLLGNLRV
jgi:tetratricopeptide (TPR) repeat protein